MCTRDPLLLQLSRLVDTIYSLDLAGISRSADPSEFAPDFPGDTPRSINLIAESARAWQTSGAAPLAWRRHTFPAPPVISPVNRILLALAATALAAGAAQAQQPIVPGELTRGSLSFSDPRLPDDSHYDEYVFAGRRGETVIVRLESRAFDSFLYLGVLRRGGVAGGYQELARDDDGGGGTDARIELRLPEDGRYLIRASSLGRETGAYTLTLTGGRRDTGDGWGRPGDPPSRRPIPGRSGDRIESGQPVEGVLSSSDPKLDNGAPFHIYRYTGRSGERLTITLRSTEFDANLVFGTPGGRHGIASALARDDDGAGGNDARIETVLPRDGEYAVRVGPLLLGSGRYVLDVASSLDDGGWDEPGEPIDEEPEEPWFDEALIGRWGLVAPGVTVNPDRWSSVSAAARMGFLTIGEDGSYAWRRNTRTSRGELESFRPRGAEPGVQYFLIAEGATEYYLSLRPFRGRDRLTLTSRATGRVVAYGYLDPTSR